MNYINKILSGFAVLLIPQLAEAQFYGGRYHDNAVEAYMSGGGGMSTLYYTPRLGDYRYGFGGHVGLGAAFHFLINDHHFELDGGTELSFYNAKITLDNFDYQSKSITGFNGPPFEVNALLTGYEERQRAILFTFPAILRYCFEVDMYHLFAGLGVKVGLPVLSTYSIRGGLINAAATSDYEKWTYEHDKKMGFGVYSAEQADKNKLLRGTTAILTVEFGMRWELPKEWAVHTSVYADVGLNNIKRSNPNSFVAYYPKEQGSAVRVSSIATSLYPTANGGVDGAIAKRIAPVSAGIKVAVYFGGWNQKNKKTGIDSTGFDTAKVAKKRNPDVVIPKDTTPAVKPSKTTKSSITGSVASKTVATAPPQTSTSLFADKPPVSSVSVEPSAAAPASPPATVAPKANDNAADSAEVKKKKSRPSPFTIQIVAASRKPRDTYFKQLTETYPQFKLKTYEAGKTTRYTYGSFSSFEEAKRWVQLFVALGYTDAFVIQIEKGKIVKSFYNNKP